MSKPKAGDSPDYVRSLGAKAIGARLRRVSERIDQDAARLYALVDADFEQRWYGLINQLALYGPMSVSDIAQRLGITHVSVSQARTSMESAGLIESRPDPEDGRRRELLLTRKGKSLVKRMTPLWDALSESAEEIEQEADNVIGALDRLEQALTRQSLYDRVKRKIE